MFTRLMQKKHGEYYFVGDVHGNFTKLANSLAHIGFDQRYDTLVCVGDLVDRGPESADILQFLRYPFIRSVMGNHEVFAIQYSGIRTSPQFHINPTDYIRWGGEWFMNLLPQTRQKIAARLSKLPIAIEVMTAKGKIGVVHGNIPNTWADTIARLLGDDLNKRLTIIDWCQWDRSKLKAEDRSGVDDLRALVTGHSPVIAATKHGNRYYIDTNSRFGGEFTFLRGSDLKTIAITRDDLEQRAQARVYKSMSDLWGPAAHPPEEH